MINYDNYDLSFPDQPVIDHYLPVWASLPSFRSKPAFIWHSDDSSSSSKQTSLLTYSHLNHSVQSISSQLLLRLRRRDTVLILCQPGLELVEIIFGCQRSGLISVPMFPPNPSFLDQTSYHHLARVISQTKPRAAIAHPHYVASVRRYINSSSSNPKLARLLEKLVWISTSEISNSKSSSKEDAEGLKNDAESCGPDDVYLIQYTSGATGLPKPVQITAGAAVHNVRVARKAYDLHPNSVIASWLPQYHDCGLQFLLLTIVSGATCVLTSPFEFLARPRIWLEMISRYEATCSPVPSFTLPLVLKRGGIRVSETESINLGSMRNLILINEPIYKSEVDEFVEEFEKLGLNRSSISPSYGLAENCTFVSTAWRDKKGIDPQFNFPSYKKLLPSAVLSSEHEDGDEEMEIVVVNEETHDLVEDGTEGEIWVSSPSNCSGYLEHPSLSREICQARLKNKISKLCFLRTGDRGVVVVAGGRDRYLYVTGRCSDVMKLADGREIHPHYLETAAQRSCPEFVRGGCLAAFKEENDVVLVVEMQGIGGKEGTLMKEICEGIKKRVMEEEDVEIGKVVLVKSGSVPKTTSGKIRRWAAKDKLIARKMRVLIEVKFKEEESEKAAANKGWIAFWSSKSSDYQNRDTSMLRSQL
ncbi:Long-chain-fatty-acid--AMP ligase FadD26 [Linum perenne]